MDAYTKCVFILQASSAWRGVGEGRVGGGVVSGGVFKLARLAGCPKQSIHVYCDVDYLYTWWPLRVSSVITDNVYSSKRALAVSCRVSLALYTLPRTCIHVVTLPLSNDAMLGNQLSHLSVSKTVNKLNISFNSVWYFITRYNLLIIRLTLRRKINEMICMITSS